MPDKISITRERAAALLAFLPRLQQHEVRHVEHGGGEEDEAGRVVFPYAVYSEVVSDFFREAAAPWWQDHEYDSDAARQLLEDDKLLAACDWDQIRNTLTWCARGERFCDGFWAGLLASDQLIALLQRIEQLAITLPEDR